MSLESNIANYVKSKGIELSVMSRETGIPYMSLYDSLFNSRKARVIKGRELIAICDFLKVNPMNFKDNEEKTLKDYTKIVVETDEENPKTIAVITCNDITPEEGYRVRLTPVYD